MKQCWASDPKDRPASMTVVCRVLKELANSHPFVHKKITMTGDIGSAPAAGVSV